MNSKHSAVYFRFDKSGGLNSISSSVSLLLSRKISQKWLRFFQVHNLIDIFIIAPDRP